MEIDRAEADSFVAHHSPPSVVTKVGIKLEDMGMGGNKRTVFYNKNKKLVEIQVRGVYYDFSHFTIRRTTAVVQ